MLRAADNPPSLCFKIENGNCSKLHQRVQLLERKISELEELCASLESEGGLTYEDSKHKDKTRASCKLRVKREVLRGFEVELQGLEQKMQNLILGSHREQP
ncbi:unnamed protein product [Calicophoron daubneyi]|uniref:Uncharacterized protein n=1 Tax=Calicophoron daubneyi TaxID=300641 RepID=A0AAV2TJU3_CALDB